MSIRLDRIVPWGRSLKEYELMFRLTHTDFQGNILDCGGGPSSFSAELFERQVVVRSIDPLYQYSGTEIEHRFMGTLDDVIAQVDRTPENWVWSYHGSSTGLRDNRIQVMQRFLVDYNSQARSGRYLVAALPDLPFTCESFDLAVCSHLLFLYSDLLSFEFHLGSLLALLNVAREVRIFPILTLAAQRSPYVTPLIQALTEVGYRATEERVQYELQRGGDHMLRIVRHT